MHEPILEYIKRRLNEVKGDWPKIATATKVQYDTIAKLAQGKRPNPTLDTIQPLVDYFAQADAQVAQLQVGREDQKAA